MNRFREQRLLAGYKTQADLAKKLFVNQTAVSQWERGVTTPSPPILLKLSQMYGVTTDYLLGNATIEKEVQQESPQGQGLEKKHLQAAFWGGEKDLDQEDLDAMWDDVKQFATFLAEKKRQEKQNND